MSRVVLASAAALGAAVLLGGCATTGTTGSSGLRSATFICEQSQPIELVFDGNIAKLTAGTTKVRLKQLAAASGFAYSGAGHSLRGKGPELVWTDAGGKAHQCQDQKWLIAQPQISEPRTDLSGTSWTLVHFQSSDDAIGIVVPPTPERYRLDFLADGNLAMQLDCNRGRASWRATPSGSGGSLTLGPGMMTRAMCRPGAIDSKFAADTLRIRSYTLRYGKLALALEADAGIYLWEPAPPASEK